MYLTKKIISATLLQIENDQVFVVFFVLQYTVILENCSRFSSHSHFRGLVPLHNACSYGHYEVTQLLIEVSQLYELGFLLTYIYRRFG